LLSTENNYLARSEDGSVEFTEVALNVTQALGDRLRLGVQLFARKLGPSGDFTAAFDWYYLDYRVDDWLGIRAGRIKIPFGLYNESNDVDAARVPVLLPQSIYPDHHRDLLLALTGGELYGNLVLGGVGQLEYRAYGGTFHLEGGAPSNPNIESTRTEVKYLAGARLMWLPPLDGLQLGGSFQALRYDAESTFDPAFTQVLIMADLAPADFGGVLTLEFPIQLWVASAEYTIGNLLLAAEYGRWWADLKSSHPTIIPSSGPTNERFYVMTSYRFAPWFSSGIYYSGYYEDVEQRDDYAKYQHDVAATVRFDLTDYWLLKLEGHLMIGTAALQPELNDGKELDTLEREWGFFLAKTTAYF